MGDDDISEGFIEKITVKSEWTSRCPELEEFRLVDLGAGPDQLQVLRDAGWVAESECYVHGLLCNQIARLENSNTEKAVRDLSKALQDDPDFARVWQSNIAMPIYDSGIDIETANELADTLMSHLFGVKES